MNFSLFSHQTSKSRLYQWITMASATPHSQRLIYDFKVNLTGSVHCPVVLICNSRFTVHSCHRNQINLLVLVGFPNPPAPARYTDSCQLGNPITREGTVLLWRSGLKCVWCGLRCFSACGECLDSEI